MITLRQSAAGTLLWNYDATGAPKVPCLQMSILTVLKIAFSKPLSQKSDKTGAMALRLSASMN
jgi:hypothetical protein